MKKCYLEWSVYWDARMKTCDRRMKRYFMTDLPKQVPELSSSATIVPMEETGKAKT